MHLLTEGNSKAQKSRKFGYLTATLELAPGKLSGVELCPGRGKCYASCVFNVGFGTMPTVWKKRVERARLWNKDPDTFSAQLRDDIYKLLWKAEDLKLRPAVRLNTFSDIPWERVDRDLFDRFPEVQFYDYTKIWSRVLNPHMPPNYSLTWSCSERDWEGPNPAENRAGALVNGRNLAVVVDGGFRKGMTAIVPYWPDKMRPAQLLHRACFDGDQHDLTFLHPAGSVLVLSPKGKAKHIKPERRGFVIDGPDRQNHIYL